MVKSIVPPLLCFALVTTLMSSPGVSALGGSNCFNILKKRRRQIKKHLLDTDSSEMELVLKRKKITPESSNMKASSRHKKQPEGGGRGRRGPNKIAKNHGRNELGWIAHVSTKDELGWIAQVSSL